MLMCLSVAGCVSPPTQDGQNGPAVADTLPPTNDPLPVPSETISEEPTQVPSGTGQAPRPEVGDYVLAGLEGPITTPESTTVVLRTEQGQEVDRFRLPGARAIHAEPGGRWALVQTSNDQWALLDAATTGLRLVSFPAEAPNTVPRIRGPVAIWDRGETQWLLRLDGGQPQDLTEMFGQPVELLEVTTDGAYAMVQRQETYLLNTISGEIRRLDPAAQHTLGPDGTVASVIERQAEPGPQAPPSPAGSTAGPTPEPTPAQEWILSTHAAERSDDPDVTVLPGPGLPVVLPGGDVAVLGDPAVLVAADGTLAPLPAVTDIQASPVVAADGTTVIAATGKGLAVVDTAGRTVEMVAESLGFVPIPARAPTWVWALTSEASPGVLVLDTTSGVSARLLPDTLTTAFDSLADDGSVGAARTGPDSTTGTFVWADGTLQPIADGAQTEPVAIHPAGLIAAVPVHNTGGRSLFVGPITGPSVEIPDGRSPAWLATS